jgi:haloalkane dehalogenase
MLLTDNGITRIFMYLGSETALSDRDLEMYRRPFHRRLRRRSTAVYRGEILASGSYLTQVNHGLKKIEDRRALIIWGARDLNSESTDLKRFEQIFPNHQTVLLEKARHFVTEDAPQEICAAMREFLA